MAERNKTGEQLRLPKIIKVEAGDVIEAVSIDGIVKIVFIDNLQTNIVIERFARDKAAKERALKALERPVARYVAAKLTEAGRSHLGSDEITVSAEMEIAGQTDVLGRIFNSLLRQDLSLNQIKLELRGLVLLKGGIAEVHIGEPHPSILNIYDDLVGLLENTIREREESVREKRRTN